MSRALLVRVRRAKRRRVPPERPENFDSLSPNDQLAWLVENGVKLSDLLGDDNGGIGARAVNAAAPQPVPVARVEVTPPAPVVEVKPAQPAPLPRPLPAPPRPPAPPQPRQWWEEKCRWRARGLQDYYDDEPLKDDEDWEEW
jgi:hypothetical protein